LSQAQLKKLFEDAGVTLADREFIGVSENYACTRSGISLDGFLTYMHDKTRQVGEATMWRWLEAWGYDRDLYSVKSRRFILTIHTTDQIQVLMKNQIGSGISNLVDQQLLQSYGVQKTVIRSLQLYCLYEPNANSFIYGIFNSGSRPAEVEFDASRSQGAVYGTGNPITRCTVKEHMWEVLNYFQIDRDCQRCSINPQLRVLR
jgi:hypothetical protein